MKPPRGGSMLMEAAAAIMLITLALAGVAQLLVAVGQQQRGIEWRRQANREAENVMEQILVRDYEQVAAGKLGTIAVSAKTRLPAPRVSVEVTDLEESPAARRVQVEVGWRNLNGEVEHVRLVAWKFAAPS